MIQIDPPPIPILTKSAPHSAKNLNPSASTTLPAPTLTEQLEKELKVLQKKIVNQKSKQDDRVTKTIQEYQEKKAYYENHPLVVNYLYLQNEVNEILQTINQQMNNALK